MTALGDWMSGHLLGGQYGDTGWQTLLGEFRGRYPSNRAAARALGVNESVLRRALSGQTKQPKASTIEAIRRASLAPGARDKDAVSIPTIQRDDGRHRTLTDRNLNLAPGTMDKAADTWVKTGDQEAAAAVFLAGIRTTFYRAYLVPREGALRPVEPSPGGGTPSGGTQGDEEDGPDYYYDDAGNAYEVDSEDADLDYYDDFYDYADEVYAGEGDRYGGDIA